MTSRALGAACALLAALAFVTAFAGGAAPKLVPGWWDGHPRIEGRVFERKDLHVGLVTAYGCNRGETIKCQPLTTEMSRISVGYIELCVLAMIAITAVALGRSTWKVGDRRKQLGKALLIQAGIAALGGVVVLALGPQIKVTQRFEAPIGMGMAALWTGIVFSLIAAAIAIRLKPEPLRLRSSQAHKVQAPPLPAPSRPLSSSPVHAEKAESPPLPKVKTTATRPPPIPGIHSAAPAIVGGSAGTSSGIDGNAVNSGATLAIRGRSNSTGPAPMPTAAAPPAVASVDSATDNAAAFGRGTVPPPLSAISFWSAPPIAPVPPAAAIAPSPVAQPPLAQQPLAPPPLPPPPLPPPTVSLSPVASPLSGAAVSTTLPPPIPVPGAASASSEPRSMPPALPTLIHAVPPPPSATAEPVSPPGAPDEPPNPEATSDPTLTTTAIGTEAQSDAEDIITANMAAASPAAETPPPSVEAVEPPAPDPAPPPVDVPISTAPASLPPPKKAAPADSELAAACPQCEAAMAWVEEHLRFYCGECRMYF